MDVATADAGPGENGRVTLRPMLAAAVGPDDPRRAAEFADPDDQRFVEQAASIQVVEQGGETLVGRGHQAVLELIEIVAVRIPEVLSVVVPVDRHQADARLDEPARQQQALAVDVPAVAVAESGVFPIELKCPRASARRRASSAFCW